MIPPRSTASYSEVAWRFRYHPATTNEVKQSHEWIRKCCGDLANVFLGLPEGREKATALTKLEEAMMWANAAIARYKEKEDDDDV